VTPFALTSLVPHRRSPVDRPRQFLWLKGRRYLSSRSDFNSQWRETATSQRRRNNCLTVEMENGAPANYLAKVYNFYKGK